MIFLILPFYIIGWILFVALSRPETADEGALMMLVGIVWPLFLVGWIVSRPYA